MDLIRQFYIVCFVDILINEVTFHKNAALCQSNNTNNNLTSVALESSGARAQTRNKTKSLIIFKSWGHTWVIISLRGCRLFKVKKQF